MKFAMKASALLLSAVITISPAIAGQLTVETNKTRPVHLSGEASSIVIGNPGVADVAVLDENTLLVTGKMFGTTNLLVYDKSGDQIYRADIVVTTNTSSLVTVTRAGRNNTYDCNGTCRPTLTIGDEQGFYESTNRQVLSQKSFSEAN